ncbi:MAG: nucleoside triphosphate pyrophosphatase [Gammaproteobacteria bacterium]
MSESDIPLSGFNNFILASGSKIRRDILSNQGFSFKVKKANVDEEAIKQSIKELSYGEQAKKLAEAKAGKVSKTNSGIYVVGADQICVCNNEVFNKPASFEVALRNLTKLSGNTHFQYSGISIHLNGEKVWSAYEKASLTMKNLNKQQLKDYLNLDEPYESCGSYKYESHGHKLFLKVEGSDHTVQGLALVSLLKAFKRLSND